MHWISRHLLLSCLPSYCHDLVRLGPAEEGPQVLLLLIETGASNASLLSMYTFEVLGHVGSYDPDG